MSGEYGIKNFDLGKGRSIELLASNDAEVSQSFYYQVKVDQKIIVPPFMICVGHDRGQLKFRTILAKDGDLVGIFEQKHPGELLALHDLTTRRRRPAISAVLASLWGWPSVEEGVATEGHPYNDFECQLCSPEALTFGRPMPSFLMRERSVLA